MTIDKAALFESTRALWPEAIDLSSEPDAPTRIYRALEDMFPLRMNGASSRYGRFVKLFTKSRSERWSTTCQSSRRVR